jgi:tetratricopeptide (TPR) repeat protein
MNRHLFLGLMVGVVTLGLGYWMGREQALAAQVVTPPPPVAPLPVASKAQQAFDILIAKSPEEISQIDLTTLSLSCLGGLPDTDGIDLDQARSRIDKLAALVKDKTAAAEKIMLSENPKFKDSPEYRALMLVGTLQDDFNYAHETFQTSAIPRPPVDDQGKNRPEDMFFHGGANQVEGPEIDNPILFVAVGQKLGYPVKLVAAPGHLFARWETPDGKTLFDIEETPDTMRPRYNDYYRKRKIPNSDKVVKEGHFFQSLTPLQAFAVMLQARGNCLQNLGRTAEADEAYAAAHRFAPDVPLYSEFLYSSVDSELKQLNYSWRQIEDSNVERFYTPPVPTEIRP